MKDIIWGGTIKDIMMCKKLKIVCLCGSTKFKTEYETANRDFFLIPIVMEYIMIML